MGWFSEFGSLNGTAPLNVSPSGPGGGLMGETVGGGAPVSYGGGVLNFSNGLSLAGIESAGTGTRTITGDNPSVPASDSTYYYVEKSRPDIHSVIYWKIPKNQTVDYLWAKNYTFSVSNPATKPTISQVLNSTFYQLIDWTKKLGVHGSQVGDNITFNDKGSFIHGWRGSDTITGGAGKDDVWEGARPGDRNVIDLKGGVDGINYSFVWEVKTNESGVVINGGFDGGGLGDTLIGVEFISATEKDDSILVPLTDTRFNEWSDSYTQGEAGNDRIRGNSQANAIVGGTGNDELSGMGEDDDLQGEAGNDTLDGGVGRDNLWGGLDDDSITGGDDDDFIEGDEGTDTLDGGSGSDVIWDLGRTGDRNTVDGGGGNDFLSYGHSPDNATNDVGVVINGGTSGASLGDTVEGVENVTTTEFGDDVALHAPDGSADAETDTYLFAGKGNDSVVGSDVDDRMFLGDGDDTAYFSMGQDTIWGEVGEDVFEWRPGDDLGSSDHTFVDGGDDPEDSKDVLRLPGSVSDYVITAVGDGRTGFRHKASGFEVGTRGVELVDFIDDPVRQNVTIKDGSFVSEAATRMVEIYSGSALGDWHPMAAMELGLLSGGSLDGGDYTMLDGVYVHESGLLNATDTKVSITSGVIDGEVTLMVTFKGSDPRLDELGDWWHDVTGVDGFYSKHQTLVAGLIDYVTDPTNQVERVVVTGHSLGGAMTQRLLQDLRNATTGVTLEGFTFGSIGANSAKANAPDLINFLHSGDIANLINQGIETRAGAFVYLESETSTFDYAIPAALLGALRGGLAGSLSSIALAALTQAAQRHFKEPYKDDVAELLGEANDSNSLFHSSELASALRNGLPWSGEIGGTMAGGRMIQIFVGGSAANQYNIKADDDYVLAGSGDDRLTLLDHPATLRRHIDGGAGSNDRLVVAGSSEDFSLVDLGSGVTSLRQRSDGAEIAKIKNVEVVVYRDLLDRLFGTETVQRLGPSSGAAQAAASLAPMAAAPPTYGLEPGFDYAVAGNGKMSITGTAGDDFLFVGRGDKTISMGDGNDVVIVKAVAGTGVPKETIVIDGGHGADIMQGGRGAETFVVDDSRDIVHDDGGRDTVKSSVDYLLPTGIESLVLTGMAKYGLGNTGANTITGNKAANVLDGAKGNDSLAGGKGKDTLSGGLGQDSLTGGDKADTFVFDVKPGGKHADIITDFRHNTDIIGLDDLVFAAIGPKLEAKEFYAAAGATRAHDRDDRIVYDTRTGKLYYDDDGNKAGGHAAVLFATLSNKPPLDHGDFAIV